METIKNGLFRTYLDKSKRWHFWGFGVNNQIFQGPCGFLYMDGPTEYEYLLSHTQQFSGLEDKNEKPIYAGDIIEYYGNEDEGGIIVTTHEIFYQEGSFCMLDKLGAYNLSEVYKECIVVGNIFENPELLLKHDDR